MKNFFLILLFSLSFVSFVFGQQKDIIYRITGSSKDAVGYSYNVNVLILNEDKVYSLIQQEYYSKRLARKNIPSKILKTNGSWEIKNDTLKLIENDTKIEKIFIIINKKYLDKLFNNQERTNFYWKKVCN